MRTPKWGLQFLYLKLLWREKKLLLWGLLITIKTFPCGAIVFQFHYIARAITYFFPFSTPKWHLDLALLPIGRWLSDKILIGVPETSIVNYRICGGTNLVDVGEFPYPAKNVVRKLWLYHLLLGSWNHRHQSMNRPLVSEGIQCWQKSSIK